MSAYDEQDVSVHLDSAERHGPDESTFAQMLDDIPDGGTVAWLQGMGSYFFFFMDTWCDCFPSFSTFNELASGGF